MAQRRRSQPTLTALTPRPLSRLRARGDRPSNFDTASIISPCPAMNGTAARPAGGGVGTSRLDTIAKILMRLRHPARNSRWSIARRRWQVGFVVHQEGSGPTSQVPDLPSTRLATIGNEDIRSAFASSLASPLDAGPLNGIATDT